MVNRSLCKGESHVANPLTSEEFHRPISDELLEAIITYTRQQYDIPAPRIMRLPDAASGRFRGVYSTATNTITYNKDILGLVLHELAHYIDRWTNGKSPHEHHGERFGKILQEILDIWR